MHQPDGEHDGKSEAGIVAVALYSTTQPQHRDQNQAEGLHDADDHLVVADEVVQPAIGRGFQRQNPQHTGNTREFYRQPQYAQNGQYNQSEHHGCYIAEFSAGA